jgi:ornithine cyclodeaminase
MTRGALKLRFMSQEDMVRAGVLNANDCMSVMEETFRCHGQGDSFMNARDLHGTLLVWPETPSGKRMPQAGPDKRFSAMPAYIGGRFNMVGLKWYGSNASNPSERHLPRSIHLIVLNEPESGCPIAIVDGTLVSAMRTGACAGLGAKHLAAADATVLGIVGAGVIGRCAAAACIEALPNLREILIYDVNPGSADRLAGEHADSRLQFLKAKSIREVVAGGDVVVIATSGKDVPQIQGSDSTKPTLVIPLGRADVARNVYRSASLVVDDRDNLAQFIEREDPMICSELRALIREGSIGVEDFLPIAEILLGAEQRPPTGNWTVFYTFGLPIEDVAWATAVYETAVDEDLGVELDVWKEPHWI